ncbi:hypothetical protein [Mycolicibacterium arenosum]|uniref:Uncharacterized protein n=1 Tax=Mycolicibacterium arenosum TaxID=2952157 RepID=A0ABT1MBK4_9MYCO|nr:hypothetical protein [Mycolicibacterium sp. CAU 1645]MCP9276556.1 hypothetical protein [Mycolicibacterium sp. CAU 1645]
MKEVVVATPVEARAEVVGVRGDLPRFEILIRDELAAVGLPADEVFVAVRERDSMLMNMPRLLSTLEPEVLGRSYYISKMIAACSVGLFDAALNYLWDELVNELRRRVAGFDLGYFYDIAAPSPDLRKHLRDESDLPRIDDASLLRAAREIGLLTDVGYQRLDHIRFMRNHASAAHPNQVTLTGLDLANWLEVCVREVITTPPDTVTAATGRLLANIKKERLDSDAVRDAAAFFDQLPSERADTLANGLFGLYTDAQRTPIVADNVRLLWPKLWPFVSDTARRTFGVRHARARASAETAIATSARELVDLVDGAAYLTEEVRAVEMAEVLDDLMTAHLGLNNFYTEASPARRLEELTGTQGVIPEPVRSHYVRTLVEVFLGNGYGVSFAADPVYTRLLQILDGPTAGAALRLFLEPSEWLRRAYRTT